MIPKGKDIWTLYSIFKYILWPVNTHATLRINTVVHKPNRQTLYVKYIWSTFNQKEIIKNKKIHEKILTVIKA